MTYRALARKYRSAHFGELIGQDVLVRTLSNAIQNNRLHHAYLFTGIRGTGKTSTARILAKAINYTGADGTAGPTTGPTDDCAICRAIAADQHPDVIEIDAASNTGVDDVRQIIENARYAPMEARYKVFIIDEVHMLSKNAFNALLKTLEEPPAHVVFMLATTEIRKVPVTILSRCQRFDLRRIDAPTLMAHFKKIAGLEQIGIDDEALQIIARASDGSARDGLSILDQAIAQSDNTAITAAMIRNMLGQGDRDGVASLVTAVLNGDAATALDVVQNLYNSGADPLALLDDLLDAVHLITRLKIKPDLDNDPGLSPQLRQMAVTLAPQLSLAATSRAWQMLLKAQPEVAQAAMPIQALEMALIRLCYASTLPPLEELAKRGGGEQTPTNTAPANPTPAPTTTTQMRVVSNNHAIAEEKQPTAAIHALTDLRALVALAEENNDPMLAADLYTNVQLVKMQQGQIELITLRGAAKDLINALPKKLRAWTGDTWLVVPSTNGNHAAPTLAEQDRMVKDTNIAAAMDDPAITAWRKEFPNLKITDLITE